MPPPDGHADLQAIWEKAKQKALKVIPSGFFTGADLGRLLGKAQDAHRAYDKLPGTTDATKLQEAKRAARAAYLEAQRACEAYMKNVKLAEKSPANQGNAKLLKALSDVGNELAFGVSSAIDQRLKKL